MQRYRIIKTSKQKRKTAALEQLQRETNQKFLKLCKQSFKGTYKVNISSIDLTQPFRARDDRNVDRLVRIFQLEGCLMEHIQHRIPVVIRDDIWRNAQMDPDESMDFRKMHFPQNSLQCLHGHHRLWAAQQHLPLDQQEWVVDIYGVINDNTCR